MTSSPPFPATLKFSHRLTLNSVLSLILLYFFTSITAETMNWTVLIVPVASLAMFLPGIALKLPRSFDWLCFVILLHFTVGVSNSMSSHAAWHDYLQTLLSVVTFISAMMTSRWLKAWQAKKSHTTSNETE